MSSVDFESNQIIQQITAKKIIALGPKQAYLGQLCGQDVVATNSGIGKTNAAFMTTLLCQYFKLKLLINYGVGGAYPNAGLNIGDIAVAEKEIYGDEGVIEHDGFYGMERIGIPLVALSDKAYFNEFPACLSAVKAMEKILTDFKINVKTGSFVTVSTSTGINERASEMQNRYSGVCENMEGAAVAHVAAIYQVPFAELRGISNIVENRDRSRWRLPAAAQNAQHGLITFLNAYRF
jgi:futalosine hydrolase